MNRVARADVHLDTGVNESRRQKRERPKRPQVRQGRNGGPSSREDSVLRQHSGPEPACRPVRVCDAYPSEEILIYYVTGRRYLKSLNCRFDFTSSGGPIHTQVDVGEKWRPFATLCIA